MNAHNNFGAVVATQSRPVDAGQRAARDAEMREPQIAPVVERPALTAPAAAPTTFERVPELADGPHETATGEPTGDARAIAGRSTRGASIAGSSPAPLTNLPVPVHAEPAHAGKREGALTCWFRQTTPVHAERLRVVSGSRGGQFISALEP